PVKYLSEVLHTAVPDDRIAVLLDREGAVIARSRNPDAYVKKLASPELRDRIATAQEGSMTLRTPADAGSFAAFTHLPHGWTAAIQVPPEIIAQPMRAWERQVLLNLIFFAALAVVGAAAAGEWIARSIAQLAAAARPIASGEVTAPVETSLREV